MNKAYLRSIMRLWAELPDRDGRHVLDVSAGAGKSTERLLGLGFKVTATNYAPERHPRMPEGADFVGGVDLNDRLPFEDESFDGVHFQEVMEHLENPAHSVREMSRVLKPDGVLVVSTPNIQSAIGRVRFALTGFFEGIKRPVSYAKPPGNADNIYMTNLPQLHYLMAHYGLSMERLQLGPFPWRGLFLAAVLYPVIWLATFAATCRPRRKDLLMKDERLARPEALDDELLGRQKAVQRRLRRMMLSKEVLLSRSLMIRARKAGRDPFDA